MLETQDLFIYFINVPLSVFFIIIFFIKSEDQFVIKAGKWLREAFCRSIMDAMTFKWVKGA